MTAELNSDVHKTIKSFLLNDSTKDTNPIHAEGDSFWQALKATGTELWLDTGDIDEAGRIWKKEMSALTTNNTLLNKEIQKGIYDETIKEVNTLLKELPLTDRIIEIAFVLNAKHGLRLVDRFSGKVSVELHTDLSHDVERTVAYGKRLFDICPSNFIVKVPLTPSGLLGARALHEAGVTLNFTLNFSARQNAIIASVVKPDYLNIFLGRLNAYFSGNKLGSGENVGEKATFASQHIVHELTANNPKPTKQIAASMRSGSQLATLAGTDVYTMPTKVAEEGYNSLQPQFTSQKDVDLAVSLHEDVDPQSVRMETLWDVTDKERALALDLDANPPKSSDELISRAHSVGCGDMFPRLSPEDLDLLDKDGKIPVHAKWQERVKAGDVAIDTLLNIAGLASFTQDQAALDSRIQGLIA